MSLETQVMDSMKQAMKAKDSNKLTALRAIKAAFLNLNTSEQFAGKEVTDEARMKSLKTMLKQRTESATIYKDNNRQDLHDKEVFEISVIKQFLPEELSSADIEAEVKQAIAETGATSAKEMGKVMGVLTKKLLGKVDNKVMSELVKKHLA